MSMVDEDLVVKLRQLHDAKKFEDMRTVLKDCGGIGRLIALAERGLGIKAKKPAPAAAGKVENKTMTRLPDGFPDQAMKDRAVAYWARKRRPDLVANVEHEAEKFVNTYMGNGKKAESWPHKWQTWCANALEFNKPPRADGPAAALAFEQTNEGGWYGRIKEFYERAFWGSTWGTRPPGTATDPLPPGCMVPASVMKRWNENRRRTG